MIYCCTVDSHSEGITDDSDCILPKLKYVIGCLYTRNSCAIVVLLDDRECDSHDTSAIVTKMSYF